MINNLELLVSEADALIAALTEYDEATERLCGVNLEQESIFAIGEIENILGERERIIPKAAKAHMELMALIDEQDVDGKDALRRMFSVGGKGKKAPASGGEFSIRDKIYELMSLHSGIMRKDDDFKSRLTGKYDEVKEMMRSSQEDRKKLDFFNTAAFSGQGFPGKNTGFKV
ncbi:MAG: hypothetical protein LBI38_06400 [Oscillospiraceae bacterium]|jgi:hypothetical protein|nr:hypothetical protein [Oscillospiraceae bacterium]